MEACSGRQPSRLKGKVGMKKWTGSLLARVKRVQEEAKEEETSKVCRRREREREREIIAKKKQYIGKARAAIGP